MSDIDFKNIPHYREHFLDGSHSDYEASEFVILPVPYDSTTSFKTGSRHGPKAIIVASRQLEDYDIEMNFDVSSVGIYTAPEIESHVDGPKHMIDRIERAVRLSSENGKIVGILGGEHTVTIGAVRHFKNVYPDLSVLYLDAHADLRSEYMSSPWGHASVARRIHEICPIVEVGVRSLSVQENDFIKSEKIPIVFWPTSLTEECLTDTVLKSLSKHVYISIDLDVFDPSIMSSVGTPEPDGMLWPEVLRLLRSVTKERRVVGFDVVELSPGEGPESCTFTAAKLVYKMVGYVSETNN
tara:strand:+ start:3323 stop:4213 length:891 start_codon:yes stop_codon:yes gene_type:complete